MGEIITKKFLQRSWDVDTRKWSIWVPVSDARRVVVIAYEDLCAAFPGFKEIYTPEPDEPKE